MNFLKTVSLSRPFLIVNILLSLTYFTCVAFFFPIGNPWLFGLLVAAEVYHLWQVAGYLHAVWPRARTRQFDAHVTDDVAVFITVCGEPEDIIEDTVKAALAMRYGGHFSVYILNDGKVANRPNWHEAEEIAERNGITCITREVGGGAKAGNINNALKQTREPYFVVFDADHIPKRHFLNAMMGYFADPRVAFVQSPQYYKNYGDNIVTGGAWEQQELFFGAIMKGKDTTNSAFMCGTNMVLKREALSEVGGMSEFSIAEDFLTSLLVHDKGWKSVYVSEVLAEGLAPEDFLSYYKQQFRWTRGSLEVVFKYNPLLRRGLSFNQRVQYLASASFYLSGLIVALNALLPLLYFFTGLEPLRINTMLLALIFLPYLFITLWTLQLSSNYSFTFRALSYSVSSFPLHLKAVGQIITGRKTGFVVTSKRAVAGSNGRLVTPHLVYIGLVAVGIVYAVFREGNLSAAILSNAAWAFVYIAIFVPFIAAAFYKPEVEADADEEVLPEPDADGKSITEEAVQ